MSLLIEDVIINLSPVLKRLEDGVYLNVFGGQFYMVGKRFLLNVILLKVIFE